MLASLFDICTPRKDVLGGIAESDFAADLAQVLRGSAPKEYQNPALFFANTHPTRGLRNLLSNVCLRLKGSTDQTSAIFRLDTNFGGGKTHALIAMAHVAKLGATPPEIANIEEFISEEQLPDEPVRVAAFDGENADPINGHFLGDGIRAYTPWGELAYALGGAQGYEILRKSDEQKTAPGADTLRELINGKPALFLLDELSIYLRKQGARDAAQAARQLTAFLTALFKAVETSPRTALVYTLAIGKRDGKAIDAYSSENQTIADMMQEAESVSARKATLLDPTEEDETVKVLRRRLFAHIDEAKANEVVDAYARLWQHNREALPPAGARDTRIEEFREGFPLHPELIETLKEKTSTLGNFQRVRGMLRLLARTVERLWSQRPDYTHAIHLHHIDLSHTPLRQEIVTRLGQQSFVPALKADIAASAGDTPSLAERLDVDLYRNMPPYASWVARTIFFHTLAFNDNLKGANEAELRYAMLCPDADISFIDSAIRKFRLESAYLDDRPNAPLRFLVEPNLTQLVHQRERQVEPQEIRSRLNDEIRSIFSGSFFRPIFFPATSKDIEDNADKPMLAVMGYEACAVSDSSSLVTIPDLVCRLFRDKSPGGPARINLNNVVFAVVEENRVEDMKSQVRRRLALEDMRNTPSLQQDLADHQKAKLNEYYEVSKQQMAIAIQQAYRHVFYPSKTARQEGAPVELAHTTVELQAASARPGSGQEQVVRVLIDMNKLRLKSGSPDTPKYLMQCTPLGNRGKLSTLELHNEYRRNTRLAILESDDILLNGIRNGISEGQLVYQNGDLVCGKGDPFPEIAISDEALVWTAAEAQHQRIWPRETRDTDSSGGKKSTKTEKKDFPKPPKEEDETPPKPQPTDVAEKISHKGVLREVFKRIFDDAKAVRWTGIATMELLLNDFQDSLALAILSGSLQQCEKKVDIEATLSTRNGSDISCSFQGVPNDVQQFRQLLWPQWQTAAEKEATVRVSLAFLGDGLALDDAGIAAFTKVFAGLGSQTAYVAATQRS